MIPISQLVDSDRVSSDSDPVLSADSILIKWRPAQQQGGIESWECGNHTIISPVGYFVSWLVSLSSEEIVGFIVQGQSHHVFQF